MTAPTEPPRPSKLEVMRALLENAEAQVHLDARKSGVELPDRLRTSSNVRLDYGYSLVPPIPDLRIDEAGIFATLSFNRIPFATFIPWSAIFLIADFAGRGAVWREDLPPELSTDLDTSTTSPGGATSPGRGTALAGLGHAESDTASGTPGAVRVTERDIAPPRRFTVLDGDEPLRSGRGTGIQSATTGDDEKPAPDPQRPRPALRLVK